MDDLFNNTMKTHRRMLKLVAVWPRKKKHILYELLRYFNIIILLSCTSCSIAGVCLHLRNIDEIAFGLSCAAALFQSSQKILVIILKQQKFKEVLRLYKSTELNYVQDEIFRDYLRKRITLSNRLRNMFLAAGIATVVVMMVTPLLLEKGSRILPMPFPISMEDKPYYVYILVFAFQCSAASITAWVSCLVDAFVFTLVWVAVAHCEILNHKIKFAPVIIAQNLKNHDDGKSADQLMNEYLNKCVSYHTAIERFVKLIEESSTFVFLLSMESLLPICLLGFSFVIVSVTSAQFGRYVVFFGAMLLPFTLFCAPGFELILQSGKIGDSCYSLEWENYNSQVRQTLFLIMERAKRPFYLTSAKLVQLSVDSLVSYLKACFSYFMVLWHVYHDTDRGKKFE